MDEKAIEYKLLDDFLQTVNLNLFTMMSLYHYRSGKFRGKAILKMKNFNFEDLGKKTI